MTFTEVKTDKKRYLGLLMLADEQESMIDLYLERGTMFVLSDGDDGEVRALCVVTDEGNSVLEIKNIAVVPEFQHSGYGREMIRFIENKYKGAYDILRVGTGDSPLTVPFYEKCGFAEAYRIKNFFTDNYDHPMFECGRQLVDMVCFEKKL
ncbi:MAG: GNAT family N-acetyltransferase [Oscillospiraceae bacterium]